MFGYVKRVVLFLHTDPPGQSMVKPFTVAHLALNNKVYNDILNRNSPRQYC